MFFENSTRPFFLVLVTMVLAGCGNGPGADLTAEDQLRAAINPIDESYAVGEIGFSDDDVADSGKAYCQVVILLNPNSGMLLDGDTAQRLVDIISATVIEIYPEATFLNLFISTRPNMDKFQSAETIALDDLTLTLGMNREEIESALEGSEWRVSANMGDYWGIAARWPKSVEVYFESDADDAKVVFFVPNPSGSGGGLSVISAKMTLPPTTLQEE